MKMALFEILGAFSLDRCPVPLVPEHHRTAAIFTLGDRAFKTGIGQGMVLGPHRQPLVIGIEAGPLGHGPALEDTVQLQTEIIVQPAGSVLLHDEAVRRTLFDLARGFARLPEVAPEIIVGKGVGFLCHGYPALLDLPPDELFFFEPLSDSTDFFSAAIRSMTLPPGAAPSSTSSRTFSPPDLRLAAINSFSAST